MSTSHKLLFGATMAMALAFGFFHSLWPDPDLDFDRLHIFLFNLCAGGALLLHHAIATGGTHPGRVPGVPKRVHAYFALSVLYAVTAFLELYPVTIAVSIPLVVLVESVRIERFGLLPLDFFRRVRTDEKFLHAALLCLSIGTVLASLVIVNEEHLHLIRSEKLTIDVFFLGYSFPLSLLTFSVMYGFMRPEGSRLYSALREVSFWTINLGVLTFFVFIILGNSRAEIAASHILLGAVVLTYWLFVGHARRLQQKALLASGMAFLVGTGLTGVMVLFDCVWPEVERHRQVLLVLHATIALYGWNLSGLLVVVRRTDFPIFRRPWLVIALHWLTVLVLVPLGKVHGPVALAALPAFILVLGAFFFSRGMKAAAT